MESFSRIDQWIRAKYDRKQYAKKGEIPDPDTIPLPEGIVDVKASMICVHTLPYGESLTFTAATILASCSLS